MTGLTRSGMMGRVPPTDEAARPERRAHPWLARLAVALFVANYGSSLIGDLLWASLVDRNPELLIALNPRIRYLTLVTTSLGPVAFYGIGFARLIIGDPAAYFLGRWYGKDALGWVKRRSRTYGPLVEDGVRLFGKLAYPIVFFAPNAWICVIAGATRMRVSVFLGLNVVGTIVRLGLIRIAGVTFDDQIGGLRDLIAQYRTPLLVVSALAVAWTLFREFRSDDSELDMVRELTADDRDGDSTPRSPQT